MKKVLLTYYDVPTINIGDYIQSLAAKQFFDDEDHVLWNRDELSKYTGTPAKVILNAWFTHKPANWPPSDNLIPLFVAFHANSSSSDALTAEKSLSYLKRYEPIGCRDFYTVNLLKTKGIEAYFSSCLTTTLFQSYNSEVRKKIYIVDPFAYMPNGKGFVEIIKSVLLSTIYFIPTFKMIRKYKQTNKYTINFTKIGIGRILLATKSYLILKKIVDKNVLDNAILITHYHQYKEYSCDDDRFKRADEILKMYASAKLVITSRIHCALPSIGFGTPVVYLKNLSEKEESICRYEGIESFFNIISIKGNKIIENFLSQKIGITTNFHNKTNFQSYATELIEKCKNHFQQ
jgi:hypothetical protein